MREQKLLLVAIDWYRPEHNRVNVGLFARWFQQHGIPVTFVTNATEANEGILEVWPGIPLVRLPIPEGRKMPLDHWAFYRFVWRHRRRIGYIWLYRGRRYALLAALMVKLSGGKVIIRLDGSGGVFPGTNALARSPFRFVLPFLSREGAIRAQALPSVASQTARSGLLCKMRHALLLPLRWAVYDMPLALADVILAESPERQASVGAYDQGGKAVLYASPQPFEEVREVEVRLCAQGVRRQPVILTVGRIAPVKRIDCMLQAFNRVPPTVRDGWRLRVVGPVENPAYAQGLRALAQDLGMTEAVDFVPGLYGEDLHRAYLEASVFVLAHPSTAGGATNVIAEAMAFGCAILSTAVPEIPFMLDFGNAGLLVPPDDAAALAQALMTLLQDSALRQSLGVAARQRAEEHFSLEANILPVAARLFPDVSPRDAARLVQSNNSSRTRRGPVETSTSPPPDPDNT